MQRQPHFEANLEGCHTLSPLPLSIFKGFPEYQFSRTSNLLNLTVSACSQATKKLVIKIPGQSFKKPSQKSRCKCPTLPQTHSWNHTQITLTTNTLKWPLGFFTAKPQLHRKSKDLAISPETAETDGAKHTNWQVRALMELQHQAVVLIHCFQWPRPVYRSKAEAFTFNPSYL